MEIISKTYRHTLFLIGIIVPITVFQIESAYAENKARSPQVETKIINGEQSKSDAWPWMAAILTTTDTQKSVFDRQICGGTLIAPEWILTAAHCIEGNSDSNLEVLLGQNNLEGTEGETIPVTNFIIHPDRDSESYYADLALLHLQRPSSIKPVFIAENFDFLLEKGEPVMSMGWGATNQDPLFGDSYPTNLQQVELNINNNSICNFFSLPDNVICIDTIEEKTPCHGDSGGPLLIFDSRNQSWNQIGIVSGGTAETCTEQGATEVFTQTDKFKQFIDSTINQTQQPPEEFLIKCANKYPKYIGQIDGSAFSCDAGSIMCLNTTGGSEMNIKQISILLDNPNEVLEYYVDGEMHKITYSELGYCN